MSRGGMIIRGPLGYAARWVRGVHLEASTSSCVRSIPGQPLPSHTARAPPSTHRLTLGFASCQVMPMMALATGTEAECITTMTSECKAVGGTMKDSACKSGGEMCRGQITGMTPAGNQCTDDASCPVTEREIPLCCDYWASLYKSSCSGADSAKIDAQVRIRLRVARVRGAHREFCHCSDSLPLSPCSVR